MIGPEFTTEEMVDELERIATQAERMAEIRARYDLDPSIDTMRQAALYRAIAARLSDLPDVSAALALLDEFATLKAWDAWRDSIAKGDVGSWPRDCYESQLDAIREALTSRTPWQPPPEAERADGFRCLGWIPRHKEWLTIWWNVLPGGSSWWFRSRIVTPTAFAPLPPPPKESTNG